MATYVDKDSYVDAIRRIVDYLRRKYPLYPAEGERVAVSTGDQALMSLMANLWDSASYANATDTFLVLDAKTCEWALTALIGRIHHGRPRFHPDAEFLERNFRAIQANQAPKEVVEEAA